MKGSQLFWCGAMLSAGVAASGATVGTTNRAADALQFIDGSILHGQMERIDVNEGLSWSTPLAKNPIRFSPGHIDTVRFSHAQSVRLAPSCHLTFADGDDLFGSISKLDSDRLEFHTWFGGTMSIPRPAIRAITFLSKNYSIDYEGPYDTAGWVIVNNTQDAWTFRDGAFVGNGAGTLGRDFSLTNSATIEFDMAWTGLSQLLVDLYCDALDRVEYSSGSYVLEFNPRQITFRHVQNALIARNIGGITPYDLTQKGQMHVTIQCNRQEQTVSVFIDNVLARKWKDDSGGRGTGTGILFQQENLGGATVKLSNLKISQWEGAYEPDTSMATTNGDAIHFVNHDRASGQVKAIHDGKVRLELGGHAFDVPLERITQLNFMVTNAIAEPRGPWVVRAHFPGGGSVSFSLEKWDDDVVAGKSAVFGAVAFQSSAIRELEFNLDRPKNIAAAAATKEYEDLDE